MGYPYLVSLNLDEFMIGRPPVMNSDDHNDQPLIKNLIISAKQINVMQNPSSSSSSSSCTSIIHENPNSKPNVWNNQIQNPLNYAMQMGDHLRNIGEDFLQNPAPLMTKLDQEYLNWQQQQQEQEMMESMEAETVVGSDFRGFDENKVTTTQANVEKNRSNDDLMKDEMRVKSVERRQRRMIKNRESAARSRAKKQDYINQLQHKVSQLQTSNALLKKRKEVCALWNSNPISEPRYQLRRTSSAPF